MNNLVRVTEPINQPITLAHAKAHLNVWHADDDTLITALIGAAVASVEGPTGIGVALITQTWMQTLSRPVAGTVHIDLSPVQTVIKVEIQSDGEWSDVAPSAYRVETGQRPALVTPVGCWPAHEAMRITFEAGFGDEAEDVPVDLIAAMLLTVGYLYENRAEDAPAPRAVEAILARYR